MERGRISRRRDCHASDRSHVSVDPFSVPLIVDCLTSPEHNTEKQPDSDSELRGRRLAWSRGLTPPRGYQSPVLDGDPGALSTPRNRGQRSWVQIPPAPPSIIFSECSCAMLMEKQQDSFDRSSLLALL